MVSSYEGSQGMYWHIYAQAILKTTGADDDCSLGGHLTHKSDDSIWTLFWPNRAGIWTIQSWKAQMPGGEGGCWSFELIRAHFCQIRITTLDSKLKYQLCYSSHGSKICLIRGQIYRKECLEKAKKRMIYHSDSISKRDHDHHTHQRTHASPMFIHGRNMNTWFIDAKLLSNQLTCFFGS